MAPGRPRVGALIPLLAAVLCPVQGQFGGGGFGGGGYNPPPPICPAFSCGAGEKAVGRPDHQIWSYGCKDSGMNILSAGSFDPSNPFASMQQKNSGLDKCCVERDICKQTCGMTSKACHDNFQKCSTKICKGDQNCQLQAMISDVMSDPADPEETKGKDYKYDPEETKCKGYKRGQNDACMCVPKKEWKAATENKLKSFYGKFNPEKLDGSGEIKDVEEVWKKWKGKEPDMFLALATKYRQKAVEIRVKPKPPPYKPPPADDAGGEEEEAAVDEPEPKSAGKASEDEGSGTDAEGQAFDEKLAALEVKKRKAAEDEDYDLADQLKEESTELRKAEVKRLTEKKSQAIANEDYLEAKKVKKRLAKLEL